MRAAAERFVNLEESFTEGLVPAIELVTRDADFRTLDVDSGILRESLDTTPYWEFSRCFASNMGYSETDAARVVYRTLFFALHVAQLIGEHDFEIALPDLSVPSSPELSRDLFTTIAEKYWSRSPTAERFVGAFVDELDGSYDGRYEGLAKTAAGLVFALVDTGMNDDYVSKKIATLEAQFQGA